MVAIVHDELVVEVRDEYAERAAGYSLPRWTKRRTCLPAETKRRATGTAELPGGAHKR